MELYGTQRFKILRGPSLSLEPRWRNNDLDGFCCAGTAWGNAELLALPVERWEAALARTFAQDDQGRVNFQVVDVHIEF